MAVVAKQSVLRGLTVKDAMRRQMLQLPGGDSIGKGINHLVKYKTSALLIVDDSGHPKGVVSKTDIMGAYYAALPLESPLETIMSSPPLFCRQEASLESALELMRAHGVYRVYAQEESSPSAAGVLAYPDIVGILYQYCRECDHSLIGRRLASKPWEEKGTEDLLRFKVREVMTTTVMSFHQEDSLAEIMEGLSAYRFGAVLITNGEKLPVGIVSKTDLILAYKHGRPVEAQASTIMSTPVLSCAADAFIEDAVRQMIFAEVHRFFVISEESGEAIGVFSLSDAARLRSGSCRACMSSRIKVDDP